MMLWLSLVCTSIAKVPVLSYYYISGQGPWVSLLHGPQTHTQRKLSLNDFKTHRNVYLFAFIDITFKARDFKLLSLAWLLRLKLVLNHFFTCQGKCSTPFSSKKQAAWHCLSHSMGSTIKKRESVEKDMSFSNIQQNADNQEMSLAC